MEAETHPVCAVFLLWRVGGVVQTLRNSQGLYLPDWVSGKIWPMSARLPLQGRPWHVSNQGVRVSRVCEALRAPSPGAWDCGIVWLVVDCRLGIASMIGLRFCTIGARHASGDGDMRGHFALTTNQTGPHAASSHKCQLERRKAIDPTGGGRTALTQLATGRERA